MARIESFGSDSEIGAGLEPDGPREASKIVWPYAFYGFVSTSDDEKPTSTNNPYDGERYDGEQIRNDVDIILGDGAMRMTFKDQQRIV